MTTVTIEAIEAEQKKLADMIATLKIATLQAQAGRTIVIREMKIELKDGEHYAGIIVGKPGEASHHLILLPGDEEDINWKDAGEWAAKLGGELPTRREQALLYANLKDQFQTAWYWSSEQSASHSGYAWYQGFHYGTQDLLHEDDELRARAVRRLIIL